MTVTYSIDGVNVSLSELSDILLTNEVIVSICESVRQRIIGS